MVCGLLLVGCGVGLGGIDVGSSGFRGLIEYFYWVFYLFLFYFGFKVVGEGV